MASNNRRRARRTIAMAVTAALLSPAVRHLVRKSTASALREAVTVGRTVVRGTRNLQEASKHVRRRE